MSLLAVMLFGGFFGCSAAGDDALLVGGSNADAGSDYVEDVDDEGDGEDTPSSWELTGTLVVSDHVGNLSVDDSALNVRLLDGEQNVLCEDGVVLGTAVGRDQAHFPDEALLSWWALHIDSPTSDSCFSQDYAFPVPSVVMVGIGDMDPELRAVAGSSSDLTNIDALNGAYASIDGGETVWVFGVAGTTAGFAGEEDGPLEDWPVPEGSWDIEPLYPFPL